MMNADRLRASGGDYEFLQERLADQQQVAPELLQEVRSPPPIAVAASEEPLLGGRQHSRQVNYQLVVN
jgi:hypothetical protein